MPNMTSESASRQNSDDFLPTRKSLLGRLKNGEDQESWRDFFRTYQRMIHGVAVKAGLTEAEADDVVQETFIAVSKKMPEFQYDSSIGSFKGWLRRTTRWRIADQFRKRCRRLPAKTKTSRTSRRTATIERVPDPAGNKLEEIWNAEASQNILDAALEKVRRQVNASQYQLFDLYVNKQWPVEKVAQTLGVSVGRVYLAKHRISILLRKELGSLKGRSRE
ncbi:MAG TPA: sigma-70 family RNA polymerase sigma factor [Candidatus Nitrosotalea sp.]|nr:sigma-70 family RNA polymerase sigma factor [Candidatus Nitrosotalea sp.]